MDDKPTSPSAESLRTIAGLLAQGNRELHDLLEYLRKYQDFKGEVAKCEKVLRNNAEMVKTLDMWAEVKESHDALPKVVKPSKRLKGGVDPKYRIPGEVE